MENIENGEIQGTSEYDEQRFFKIMKSNFILMLYNFVEAIIVNGMLEIYDDLKNNDCSYSQVIDEIQNIWSNTKIDEIYNNTTSKATYENKVQQIIRDITTNSPISLTKDSLGISGNLNAKKIKELCDRHRIRYQLQTQGESLDRIKRDRNSLAHGDISFSDCSRDLTIIDLKNIEEEVFLFMKNILNGMENYYDNKLSMSFR